MCLVYFQVTYLIFSISPFFPLVSANCDSCDLLFVNGNVSVSNVELLISCFLLAGGVVGNLRSVENTTT